MTNRTFKTALYAAGAVTLALSVTTASFAQFQRNQTRQNQQSSNPLGDLIGMIASASAKSKAKKGWAQVAPEIQQCVNTYLESRKITVQQMIAEGLAPSHEKVTPIVTMCQTVMATQLKANFPCNIAKAKGQQVPTTCVQSYAKAVNGKWVPVSRDDFLRAGSNNEQVTIADFETQAAQTTRLAEEKRLAQEAAAKAEAARLERLSKAIEIFAACSGFWGYIGKNEREPSFSLEIRPDKTFWVQFSDYGVSKGNVVEKNGNLELFDPEYHDKFTLKKCSTSGATFIFAASQYSTEKTFYIERFQGDYWSEAKRRGLKIHTH